MVAFLRAINVGGHVVTMEELRRHFVKAGARNVETFIASGNVVFDWPSTDAKDAETRIEERLQKALGYEVKTFVRSTADVAAIAQGLLPFSTGEVINVDGGFHLRRL